MGVLNHLKIKLKLALLLGLSALALVVAILMSAEIIHQRMMTGRLDKLHAVVDVAIGTAHWLQKDVDAGKMTKDQAIERFGAFIADMW
jgi:methyl-accepting chemotaxis protein